MTFDISVVATQANPSTTASIEASPVASPAASPAASPSVQPTLNIGDSVSYTTSLNGVTLNNWKVFYTEGNYVYLVYGDYLPNSAVNISGVEKKETHVLGFEETRDVFIAALTTKSNWSSLLTGTLNENQIDYTSSSDNKVYAIGTPTIDLWVDSWNAKYPSDQIYEQYTTNEYDEEGYYIASPSLYGDTYVMAAYYDGRTTTPDCYFSYEGNYAIRPIICLPASAF